MHAYNKQVQECQGSNVLEIELVFLEDVQRRIIVEISLYKKNVVLSVLSIYEHTNSY